MVTGYAHEAEQRSIVGPTGGQIRPWPCRESSNAGCVGSPAGDSITHPFHPLRGAEYALMTRKLTWGEDRSSITTQADLNVLLAHDLARSAQNVFNNVGLFDTRKLLIQALILVSEPLVIYTELVQQCGLEIANVYRVSNHVVRKLVGLAVNDTALDATTSHPEAEAARMVVTAVVGRRKFAL